MIENATVEKHADIASNLLAAHALSGCDTAASIFGIGKPTVLKKEICPLPQLVT